MTKYFLRFIVLFSSTRYAAAFTTRSFCSERIHSQRFPLICHTLRNNNEASMISLNEEAERLLAKAKALRSEIPEEYGMKTISNAIAGKWNLKSNDDSEGEDYRLYVDIGREDGTWMDPRWGASGRRIELTIDVSFLTPSSAAGASSHVFRLQTAQFARLRRGFDEMKCHGGAYRIDLSQSNQRRTIRFYVIVDGTKEQESSSGDIHVPKGCLHFSLPTFGGVERISRKEGVVSVRQMGWHTGWRREESRIVRTFRALPISEAKAKDGF